METKLRVTTLVHVTSHGSGGRARILVSVFRHLVARDQLTNKTFKTYKIGQYLKVELIYTYETRKRQIISIAPYEGESMDFKNAYMEQMDKQKIAFEAAISNVKVVPTADFPAFEEKPVAPVSSWCDTFFVQEEERDAFVMAKKLCTDLPIKVMIIGASGYGKTSLPEAFAKQQNMKYVRFNVALVRDPEEFFGWRTVEGGDVKFTPSEFTQAITEGNAVVVLDELNRATPEMANALFPILDDSARTVVFGNEVKVGKNVIIVCTINIGYQFVGTFSIDQALLNRMDITLKVAPLPKDIEREILTRRTGIQTNKAETIVTVCNRLRDLTNDGKIIVDASTRTSLRVARFVASGASFQDAFAWALVNGCDIEERKEIIDVISSIL